MAIDIPIARSRLRLVKDQRKYMLMKYSNENMTEYLGVRSSHGNVKLYNKALERGLESDLTRLEITVDYERCSWGEFKRLFPVVLDNGSQLPDDLTGRDYVLCMACLEHPEYLQHLSYRKGKKIEQLLATTAQNVQPDELSYKDILAQILYYGKDIEPEMWADFHEVDAEIPEEWTKKKTKVFDEIQSYGQFQI